MAKRVETLRKRAGIGTDARPLAIVGIVSIDKDAQSSSPQRSSVLSRGSKLQQRYTMPTKCLCWRELID